jgi:hypothetical protein
MNHKLDKDTPRFDVQLLFDEIGVVLDDNQYRDAISLVDMYHVYMRQHQVCASCSIGYLVLSFVSACSTASSDLAKKTLQRADQKHFCGLLGRQFWRVLRTAGASGRGSILRSDATIETVTLNYSGRIC